MRNAKLLAVVLSAVLLSTLAAAARDVLVDHPKELLPEATQDAASIAAADCKADSYSAILAMLASEQCNVEPTTRRVYLKCNDFLRAANDPLVLNNAAVKRWELLAIDECKNARPVAVDFKKNAALPALKAVGNAVDGELLLKQIAFQFTSNAKASCPVGDADCPLIDISGFKYVELNNITVNVGKKKVGDLPNSVGIKISGADTIILKDVTVNQVKTGMLVAGGNLTVVNSGAAKNTGDGLKFTCSPTATNAIALSGKNSVYKNNGGAGVFVECLPVGTVSVTVNIGAGVTTGGNNGGGIWLDGTVKASIHGL